MRQHQVLIDGVRTIAWRRKPARSAKSTILVTFAGGTVGRLDASDARDKAWAEVFDSLRTSRKPAYIELDPRTRRVTSLLLPREYTVLNIREASSGGDLQIELHISHAVHYLRRENSRFEELRRLLESALRTKQRLLVTESLDSSAIIDVRLAT